MQRSNAHSLKSCSNHQSSHTQSLKFIPINLPTHDHHPQQKHTTHNIHRKDRLPIITQPQSLQIRQRRLSLPRRRTPIIPATTRLRISIAIAVDAVLGTVELDGGFYQAGEVEDEEDEGDEQDDAGEELALLD